jgi:hypothetical protein
MQKFDSNKFKLEMKQWILDNPERNIGDFEFFCAMRVPDDQKWLIKESVSWYSQLSFATNLRATRLH